MRPNATEMLRGLQTTLTSEITAEVSSPFGQSVLQVAQMLLETAISETDEAAENLVRDNEALAEILRRGDVAIGEVDPTLSEDIDAILGEAADNSLRLSALSARNQRLRASLQRLLELAEDRADKLPQDHPLMAMRREAYGHLRDVAVRGWSFWDWSSFRERMMKLRSHGT